MRPGFRDWTRQVLEFCMAEVTAATEWFSLCRGQGWAWLGPQLNPWGPLYLERNPSIGPKSLEQEGHSG